MSGIVKSSLGKSLLGVSLLGMSSLGAAAAFVFLSAMMMLAPTEASAQFNIEGMIRGAIGHGGYRHHGGGSSHHRGHSSRHERDDSDSASSDKGKDKDALDEGASSQRSGDTKPDAKLSRRLPSTPSRDAAQASDASSAKPSRTSDDEPSFAPSR
jgi:hypothetical protein